METRARLICRKKYHVLIKPVQPKSPAGVVLGETGQVFFERLQIDQEVFFTTLPVEALRRIGAPCHSLRVMINLEDGRTVESPVYSIGLSVGGRNGGSLAVAFEGALPVLGSKFLEDFGLRVNPESGSLEPSRDAHAPGECDE